MKNIYAIIGILILTAGIFIQSYFIDGYQQTAEEALEAARKWQEAYTELHQDYSQAVEKIEQLQYELGSEEE